MSGERRVKGEGDGGATKLVYHGFEEPFILANSPSLGQERQQGKDKERGGFEKSRKKGGS